MRVVSVLPSATEMVYALGHGADLVGRSEECDYPAAVRRLPAVMRPRTWDADASSASIDARVRRVRARDESLYTLDVPLLRELQPDVLLTQDLCTVCSVTGPEVQAACASAGVRPVVVSLTPRTLPEVWDSVETVGTALRDLPAGRRVADRLRAAARPPARAGRLKVAVVEWLDPPILAGLWVPEIIAAGGAVSVGPGPGEAGHRTTWAAIGAESPDLVILSPCSFSVDRTERELQTVGLAERVRSSCAPGGGFTVADEAYFSRPGPRLADGIELVRHLISRESWQPPMPARAWVPSGATA
jgi:iron complex transport system substrate-binding protein